MIGRFASALVTLVAGFTLIVFALLELSGAGWVELGLGCCVASVALVAFALDARVALQRAGDVLIGLAGAWAIIASRAYTGSPLRWLEFASGAAIALLSLVGLIGGATLADGDMRRLSEPITNAVAR